MLAIIAAKTANNVIGRDGAMPWSQPNDLQRFKSLTYGCPVIMGRKTYESMGAPLPGRKNFVITSDVEKFKQDHAKYVIDPSPVSPSILHPHDDAGLFFHSYTCRQHSRPINNTRAFVIGGHKMFYEAMQYADIMYLTELQVELEGDVYFPEFDRKDWRKVAEEKYLADDRNTYDYNFVTYVRQSA